MTIEAYLESILPTSEDVTRFLTRAAPGRPQPNRGWTHDPELGWVHDDAVHEGDGVNGTSTFYSYEDDGARKVLHATDRPCRIHTYGDSFTHCDQVNDGETWHHSPAGNFFTAWALRETVVKWLTPPPRTYGCGEKQ